MRFLVRSAAFAGLLAALPAAGGSLFSEVYAISSVDSVLCQAQEGGAAPRIACNINTIGAAFPSFNGASESTDGSNTVSVSAASTDVTVNFSFDLSGPVPIPVVTGTAAGDGSATASAQTSPWQNRASASANATGLVTGAGPGEGDGSRYNFNAAQASALSVWTSGLVFTGRSGTGLGSITFRIDGHIASTGPGDPASVEFLFRLLDPDSPFGLIASGTYRNTGEGGGLPAGGTVPPLGIPSIVDLYDPSTGDVDVTLEVPFRFEFDKPYEAVGSLSLAVLAQGGVSQFLECEVSCIPGPDSSAGGLLSFLSTVAVTRLVVPAGTLVTDLEGGALPFEVAAVPAPPAVWLLLTGIAGITAWRHGRRGLRRVGDGAPRA